MEVHVKIDNDSLDLPVLGATGVVLTEGEEALCCVRSLRNPAEDRFSFWAFEDMSVVQGEQNPKTKQDSHLRWAGIWETRPKSCKTLQLTQTI